ncbi:MAG: hypothetical protein KGL39_31200 [Patescibacteria group bacterium]|nr:hypothetical protein [Patescibacteria group bacterium]
MKFVMTPWGTLECVDNGESPELQEAMRDAQREGYRNFRDACEGDEYRGV